MNSETNSSTSSSYKHGSPVLNFFCKNRTLLSKSGNNQASNLMPVGHNSRRIKETNSFHVFPVVKTPPAKRSSKVVNPFETALAERLHLPLIGSPSMFQCPPTPQHSSTQFAWTIDDVSSLQPANVEPHETQFHDSPDPDYEAKAQSAISSYFKEQQIVPSPIDCPLRSQRIVLSEISGNTPISKPGRRIRDNVTQTILSLPPVLPKELEAALAPYFAFTEDQQSAGVAQNVSTDCFISANDHDIRDASLRRKLFDYHSAICMDDDTFADADNCVLTVSSPPPLSPELVNYKPRSSDQPFHNSKLSDSVDKSSFGSLSPIVQSASPPNLKRKSCFTVHNSSKTDEYMSHAFSGYRCPISLENADSPVCKLSPIGRFTTPDRSMAAYTFSPYRPASEISTDSISNVKISCLLVDSTKRLKPSYEMDLFGDETLEIDENDMQVSQLSAMSNISSESDTPRSKRRSASRKNLSQSFSIQCSPNNEVDIDDNEHEDDIKEPMKVFLQANRAHAIDANCNNQEAKVTTESSVFCRTDSGFNEMTTSSTQYDIKCPNEKLSQEEKTSDKYALEFSGDNADISMICCSTPSKHFGIP